MNYNKNLFKVFVATSITIFNVSCIKDASDSLVPRKHAETCSSSCDGHSFIVSGGKRHSGNHVRAHLDLANYIYSWDTDEEIKLSVTSPTTRTPVSADLHTFTLKSVNTARSTHTNFITSLTADQYATLQALPAFDYYAYYANGRTVTDTAFPNSIGFTLASSYTGVAVADFTAAKTPMVGSIKGDAPNIMYTSDELDGRLAKDVGDGLHFTFEHTTSYAAIEFDLEDILPSGLSVQSLTITVYGGNSAADNMINGTYTYDIAAGTGTLSNGTNVIIVTNIAGMSSGQRLYIPMPAKTLTGFRFDYTLSGARVGHVENAATSITFEQGKIHLIRITPQDISSIGESELLYFDIADTQHPMKVGSWLVEDSDPDTETLTREMLESGEYALAFFKFGSVIGFDISGNFTNNQMTAIRFNPSGLTYTGNGRDITGYGNNSNSLPAIPGYSNTDFSAGHTIVSNADYHNGDNIWNNGKGDPCKLAGIDMNALNALTTDQQKIAYLDGYSSGWRLPTRAENNLYVGLPADAENNTWLGQVNENGPYILDGYYQWDSGTGIFLANPAGVAQLPAAGRRTRAGGVEYQGTVGNYWSGEASKESNAYNFGFESARAVPNSPNSQYAYGYAIRCVRQ